MSNEKGLQLREKLQPFHCFAVTTDTSPPSPLFGESKQVLMTSIFPQLDSDGDIIKNKTYDLDFSFLSITYFAVYLSTNINNTFVCFVYLAKTSNRYPGPRFVLSSMIRQLAPDTSSRSFFFRLSTCTMTSSIPCSMSGWGHITL